jgi:hypothetical protein
MSALSGHGSLKPGQAVDRTGNNYCGPLVVAAIVGTSTGQVAAEVANMRQAIGGARLSNGKLRRVRGRTADKVRGTYDIELFAVLKLHGYEAAPIDVGNHYVPELLRPVHVNAAGTRFCRNGIPDAGDWLPWTIVRRTARPLWLVLPRLTSGTYIIKTPGHWALARDGQWCETLTYGEWLPYCRAPQSNRKVLQAWRVTRPEAST